MKVIKKGSEEQIKAHDTKSIEFTCRRCGCVFQADNSEYKLIQYCSSGSCSSLSFYYISISCPWCKKLNEYDFDEVKFL